MSKVKMEEKKQIGKIESVSFGNCGYQNAMIGISFTFGSEVNKWGCGDCWGNWSLERLDGAQWTEAERIKSLGLIVMKIAKLLEEAKVDEIADLKGKPVEVTFDGITGNNLKSWRILTEVL